MMIKKICVQETVDTEEKTLMFTGVWNEQNVCGDLWKDKKQVFFFVYRYFQFRDNLLFIKLITI
jgi:hypothetical protein